MFCIGDLPTGASSVVIFNLYSSLAYHVAELIDAIPILIHPGWWPPDAWDARRHCADLAVSVMRTALSVDAFARWTACLETAVSPQWTWSDVRSPWMVRHKLFLLVVSVSTVSLDSLPILCRLISRLDCVIQTPLFAPLHQAVRAHLGLPLPPLSHLGPGRAMLSLMGIDPTLVLRPADWPNHAHLVGYWFHDDAPSVDSAVVDFLETHLSQNDPPVYVGFGCVSLYFVCAISCLCMQNSLLI